MNSVVAQFIATLRALPPSERLAAIREFGMQAEELQDEALDEARRQVDMIETSPKE